MKQLTLFIMLVTAASLFAAPADDLKEAGTLRAAGKHAAASVLYQAVLDAQPDNADAMVGLGFCLLAMDGRQDEAADLFREVLVLYPGYVDAALGLATAYKRADNIPDAERILRNSRAAVNQDPKLLEYLVQQAWQLGFVEFARDLDIRHPPKTERTLVERPNRIVGDLEYSALVDGDHWLTYGATYIRFLRPDLGFTVKGHGFNRPYGTENVAGAGVFYRLRNRLTLKYDFAFSDPGDFMPRHRHQPQVELSLAPGNTVGAGGDLAFYNSGDLLLVVLFMEQRINTVALRLLGKSGRNPFGDPVMAMMFTMAKGREGEVIYKFGAAYGNETDEGWAETSSEAQVSSLFMNVNVPFSPAFGCIFTLAGEWRDAPYYRTVLGLAPYVSF